MTLAKALRAVAAYVEQHKAALAWDGRKMPSEAEKARIVAEISALGQEPDGLAAASETAQVYRREVMAVRRELQARGFMLPPEIARAIADAFSATRPCSTTPKSSSSSVRLLSRSTSTVAAGVADADHPVACPSRSPVEQSRARPSVR